MNSNYDVIVIGGGPAGSTISTLLSKKGRKVLLLEKDEFPRYHIGESLVTGVMPILEELDVLSKMEDGKFTKKYGITFVWGDNNQPWTVNFGEAGPDNNSQYEYAFEVTRSEFDHILINHAQENNVHVLQKHTVKRLLFENERCAGLQYIDNNNEIHEARARYIIDASGQNAIMGHNKKMLKYDEKLKNTAIWTYYKDAKRYEGKNSGNIIIENSGKGKGWMWFIPLKDNVTSVGWVTPSTIIKKGMIENQFYEILDNTSEVKSMLSDALQIEGFRTTRDWSYKAENFAGPGYMITGDAAGFVDPLFSTGVFLAMNSASYGAKILDQVLSDPSKEEELFKEYEMKYKAFLDKVLAFVHYFYDASRNKQKYFDKAQEIVTPIEAMTSRQEFVYLISGLAGSHIFEEKKARLIKETIK